MRLICPNCDAQYEVPDDVIPDTGRDVQCSDCGHTWFQAPASATQSAPEEEFERQPIPSEVSEILQEEAELERQARAQEAMPDEGDDATDDGLAVDPEPAPEPEPEWQPEPEQEPAFDPEPVFDNNPFAVDPDPDEPEETDAERRAREARERMERMRGVEANNPFTAASASRNSALPDVDELNSSLAPDTEAERRRNSIDLDDLNRRRRRGSGFRTGFTLMVFVGLIGMAIYVSQANIVRAMPFTADAMNAYALWVDGLRMWVADQSALRIGQLQMWVDGLLNG